MKITIAAIVVCLTLGACASTKEIRIRSEIQEVQVPLLYCPKPPQIVRPELPVHEMTEEQRYNDGELVKYYRATAQTLLGYVDELERALQSYDATNEAYAELRKKFNGEWKKEFSEVAPAQ